MLIINSTISDSQAVCDNLHTASVFSSMINFIDTQLIDLVMEVLSSNDNDITLNNLSLHYNWVNEDKYSMTLSLHHLGNKTTYKWESVICHSVSLSNILIKMTHDVMEHLNKGVCEICY